MDSSAGRFGFWFSMGLFWLGCCYFPDVEVDRRGCCWEEGKVSWMLFVNRGCFDGFWGSDLVI